MEANGAPFTPSLCQCSILRVFKAKATQIREKSERTLESLRIELGTSSTEGSALTNCATRLLLNSSSIEFARPTGKNHWIQYIFLSCRLSYQCITVAWNRGIYLPVGYLQKCSQIESSLSLRAVASLVCVLLRWTQLAVQSNRRVVRGVPGVLEPPSNTSILHCVSF